MTIDWGRVRADFPILARTVHGHPLVYLDSAATAQKPNAVIDAIATFYREHCANINRSVYTLAAEATEAFEAARARLATFLGAEGPESIVFVRNTTEAINLVADAWARRTLRPGDEIVVTEMEHHSNLVPWQVVAAETGATLRHIPVTPAGELDLEAAEALISERTRLLAVVHASNALGTINPVERLAALAHRHGALVLVDGAQSVPHLPVDVHELGCDFLALSGHKLYGPCGIGALYARPELLASMEPFLTGGGMISEVFLDHATWAPPPMRFEAGTPHIAGAVGLHAALDYVDAIGLPAIRAHERALTAYALERLAAVPHLRLFGPRDPDRQIGVISFEVEGVHPHDVGTVLDFAGVAVRSGHHCCQPLLRRLDVHFTSRASFGLYNTEADVDALVEAVATVRQVMGKNRVPSPAGTP